MHCLLRTKKSIFTVPFWNRLAVPKIRPQNRQISREGQIWNRGGPHMRNLISIDFLAPKMEPESVYVVSAVSVHWLEYGDCDGVRPRQNTIPG